MIFCKVRRITADTDGHQTSLDFVSLKGQAVIIFCVTVHACGNAVAWKRAVISHLHLIAQF